MKHKHSLVTGVVAIVALLILAGCGPGQAGDELSQTTIINTIDNTDSASGSSTEQGGESMNQGIFTAGEYTVDGAYQTPAGQELLGVTVLLLTDGTIEDVSVEQKGVAPISKKLQADFADNYKVEVVGKNIAELKLSKISGSSLTPNGFNDALEKIRQQAES